MVESGMLWPSEEGWWETVTWDYLAEESFTALRRERDCSAELESKLSVVDWEITAERWPVGDGDGSAEDREMVPGTAWSPETTF